MKSERVTLISHEIHAICWPARGYMRLHRNNYAVFYVGVFKFGEGEGGKKCWLHRMLSIAKLDTRDIRAA